MILLVEDEPLLRASMARGLGRLPDVEVVEAGSVREALKALERVEPSLLLSDLDLPDGSGIEVAAAVDRKSSRIPVVFVSAYVGKYRAQLARRSDVQIYEKPIPLERLRSIVEESLESRPVENAPFAVADYVQLAALGRHTVVVEVHGPSVRGRIVIENGEARCAVDTLGDGVAAFRRLAFLQSPEVRCRALGRGERFAQNITGSCESILLEAARVHDEEVEQGGEEGELEWDAADAREREPVFPDQAGANAKRFMELYDDAIDALLSKDYRRAFEAFRAAGDLSPDDASVRANLVRLREMGYAR